MNTNTNTDPTVKSNRPDSCCFVLFGVTGDLAHRLVIPALYNLAEADLLPERFCVIGVARSEVVCTEYSIQYGRREQTG